MFREQTDASSGSRRHHEQKGSLIAHLLAMERSKSASNRDGADVGTASHDNLGKRRDFYADPMATRSSSQNEAVEAAPQVDRLPSKPSTGSDWGSVFGPLGRNREPDSRIREVNPSSESEIRGSARPVSGFRENQSNFDDHRINVLPLKGRSSSQSVSMPSSKLEVTSSMCGRARRANDGGGERQEQSQNSGAQQNAGYLEYLAAKEKEKQNRVKQRTPSRAPGGRQNSNLSEDSGHASIGVFTDREGRTEVGVDMGSASDAKRMAAASEDFGFSRRSANLCSPMSNSTNPIVQKLESLKAQVAEQEEESRQEEARATYFRSKQIDDAFELCSALDKKLEDEISLREEADKRASEHVMNATDAKIGRLHAKVGNELDLLLNDIEERLGEVDDKVDSVITNVRALASTSEDSVRKFCDPTSEEAVARRDVLADLFNMVGAVSESRIAMETHFIHTFEDRCREVQSEIVEERRARENGAESQLQDAIEMLRVSSFQSAVEGECSGAILTSARTRSKEERSKRRTNNNDGDVNKDEEDSSLQPLFLSASSAAAVVTREITEMMAMLGRLKEMLEEEKKEREENHDALRQATGEAEAKARQLRRARR